MNADLVHIKKTKRCLESEAIKFKFYMILRKQLLKTIKSDRYEITDEGVLTDYRLKNSALQVKVKCI